MDGLQLSKAEYRCLSETLHQTHDVRVYKRTLAVLECARGKGIVEVARALQVTRQSIHNWAVRFQQQHTTLALIDGPRPGRPRHADDRVETLLRALLMITPDRCGYQVSTGRLLCCAIRCVSICRLSVVTSRCAFACGGWAIAGSGHVMYWRRTHNARIKIQIRRTLQRLPERSAILAEDETDLLQFLPLRAMWSLRGVPARVMLSGGNARRVVFDCLNLKTGHRLFRACRRQRAEEFQAFLQQVHHHYRGRHIVMLLDSDTSHTAKSSKALARPLGIELVWLPKRAPELNPLESLWGQAKKAVSANWQYQTIDEHVAAFLAYVRGLSNDATRRTAGLLSKHFWLRRAASNYFSPHA